jgi:hypothetical protein
MTSGSLRGPEDLRQDPRQRQGISYLVAVGRHDVVVVAACKGMVRHDVHFHEHSRAALGIQKFKTWNSGELVQWLGTVQFGWDGSLGSRMRPHVARESNQHFHETTNHKPQLEMPK